MEAPVRFVTHADIVWDIAVMGEGRFGMDWSGVLKLNALLISPTVARRQALRFGTSAPNSVSRKRRTDVWSNRSDETNPPRLNGETMIIGTRNPKPIGPGIGGLPMALASGTGVAVTYSPAVPAGAVTGGK